MDVSPQIKHFDHTIDPVAITGFIVLYAGPAEGKTMTRSELGRKTGCHPETIRYYEKIGIMPEPPRSGAGYRQYDEAHERRLGFVMRGRELGFAMADIKSLLDLVDRRAVSCAEVEKLARAHLEAVREKIATLRRMESVLDETVHACSGKDLPECPLIDTLFGVRG